MTVGHPPRLTDGVQLRDAILGPRGENKRSGRSTGLGDRRALAAALDDVHHHQARRFVGIFDLDGFKAYNDTFGHPAGDDLLVRIADRLSGVCQDQDAVFRMSGDEFCMISGEREHLLAARRVIEDRGPGFRISASLGVANLPTTPLTGTAAIAIADRRMYAAKAARPSSVDHQVTNVLLRTLAERNGPLGGHSANVSTLACQTAEKLAVGQETMQAIALASRLHDIGKMAVSDHILHKPGPLTPDEWKQMRAHTLIGEDHRPARHRWPRPRDSCASVMSATTEAAIRRPRRRADPAWRPDHLCL